MTPEKVLETVGEYRKFFQKRGMGKAFYPSHMYVENWGGSLVHCHSMLDRIEEFVRAGRMEKASRWLGFVQGVLWAGGLFTLDQLKAHNKPDESESSGSYPQLESAGVRGAAKVGRALVEGENF